MPSLLLPADPQSPSQWLRRTSLAARTGAKDEKWLQEVLFANPDLIPIQEVSPGTGGFAPICRELTIQKPGGSVFLDIFGVTPEGRLVLVECKLWRNPQARREVIAQILEYASLLSTWSFSDLTVRIQAATGSASPNPLFEMAAELFPNLEEAVFVDQVSRSLETGDFVLMIAGDGIRSDVHAIADHLNRSSGLTAQLALVEFQLWQNETGDLIVTPAIPMRSEVVQHRVLIDLSGSPLQSEQVETQKDSTEKAIDPEAAASRDQERAFWQRFVDEATFDHADQAPPSHGGGGWVKLSLPAPINAMTAFRTKSGRAGLFIRLKGDEGAAAFSHLEGLLPGLSEEMGLSYKIDRNDGGQSGADNKQAFEATLRLPYPGDPHDDDAYLAWLLATTNRAVNALRPVLSQMHVNR